MAATAPSRVRPASLTSAALLAAAAALAAPAGSLAAVLGLDVDRATGGVTLSNDTGGAVNLSAYLIESPAGRLRPALWLSISDNYDAGSPGPRQFDQVHSWVESGRPDFTTGVIEEEPSAAGANLFDGRSIDLGDVWNPGPVEDLSFVYRSGGANVAGTVTYTGVPEPSTAVPLAAASAIALTARRRRSRSRPAA